jgi:hypothetical protein
METEDYPDSADGLVLHKSSTASGYKGVSAVRFPTVGFLARDGTRVLGTFATRIEAALAYARSQLDQRDEKHHARKERRNRGTKRKHGVEHDKPESATPHTHTAANTHYSTAEAQRYTERNAEMQKELACRCLELLLRGGSTGELPPHQLILDLGCGSGLSASAIEAAGHSWIGIDIAREMLLLADRRSGSGACVGLIQADLAALPLRLGRAPLLLLPAAISVSTLQWLCEGRGAGGKGKASGGDSTAGQPPGHPAGIDASGDMAQKTEHEGGSALCRMFQQVLSLKCFTCT